MPMKPFRTNAAPIVGPTPKRTHSRQALIGISATTYLMLCLWLGPHAACWLIALAAIIAGWVWLAYRFPLVGWFTTVFFAGFISGLVGYRAPYYRPRYYRRWR
jgi:hypothetical protein